MKSKIGSFFTQNIGLKFLALFVGIAIWAVLSNAEDPTVTRTVTIPVTYTNGDQLINEEDLVLLSGPETVQITATVRQSKLSRLRPDLFTCSADLMDHGGGDLKNQRVHINVTQVGGNDIIIDWNYYRSDPNITVSMDHYIEKTFTIGILTTSELAEGLILKDTPAVEPSSVTISGPLSRFSNVSSVKATLELEELSALGAGVFALDAPLRMYDANDNAVPDTDGLMKFERDTVRITGMLAREGAVQIKVEGVTGTPKEGYRFLSMSVKPNSVAVHGLNNTSSFSGILIPASAVNISGISEDTIYEIDISRYLPEGVTVAEGSSVVQVAVSVEGRQGIQITIPKDYIVIENRQPQYNYSIQGSVTQLNVRGFKDELAAFDIASLNPWISVGALDAGTHQVKVNISQPSGYLYDNADALYVTVVVAPAETTPPDVPTQQTQQTDPSVPTESVEPTQSISPPTPEGPEESTDPTQTSEDPAETPETPTDPTDQTDPPEESPGTPDPPENPESPEG